MSDTIVGMFYFVIFMALVIAASRVLARFTGAKFLRALAPLAPVIGGSISTDSLTHGWLEGTYRDRKVQAAATPGVSPNSHGARANRYNAFDVAVLGVPGARDWTVTFGMHDVGQILSRNESWRFQSEDADLAERLKDSEIVDVLERFAGAGVRRYPTARYDARQRTLTHRDAVHPGIAPPPDHFRRQLDLVLHLAQINERLNPAATAGAAG